MNFDKASSKNWRKYEGKRITFFKTEIGGRKIRVRVHLKPREEGNIIWYLATRRSPIEEDKENRWTTPWLRARALFTHAITHIRF